MQGLNLLSLKIDELIKVLTPPIFYSNFAFWNTFVLVITFGVLIWYTIETHNLAIQAKDTNLRPVVLRSGFLNKWDDIKYTFENNCLKPGFPPLEFTILKHIATGISGHIVLNGKLHKLHFGNEISTIAENKFCFTETWGWMKPDMKIYAIFFGEGSESQKSNQIYLQYKDIEGNSYSTIENTLFEQKSFKM